MAEENNLVQDNRSFDEPFKIAFKNINALYKAYMPYLQNSGLFIAHPQKFKLGDRVVVHMVLPGESEDQINELETKVVWITPNAAQGRWVPGIGVEFASDDKSRKLREKINTLLSENSEGDAPSSTM
jgi:type IV pilus assembly protein PilZ